MCTDNTYNRHFGNWNVKAVIHSFWRHTTSLGPLTSRKGPETPTECKSESVCVSDSLINSPELVLQMLIVYALRKCAEVNKNRPLWFHNVWPFLGTSNFSLYFCILYQVPGVLFKNNKIGLRRDVGALRRWVGIIWEFSPLLDTQVSLAPIHVTP